MDTGIEVVSRRRYDQHMSTIRLYDVCVSYHRRSAVQEQYGLAPGGFVSGSHRAAPSGISAKPTSVSSTERNETLILDHLNLEIRNGETMGVLGPSGCGKTTLLRAIAGLIPISSGVITYDDQDMTNVRAGDRGIGIVFQNFALYPMMNARENVGFFFRLHNREREIPERVRYVSQVMGIGFEALLDKPPAWLSGGQRQRVAVARCIARDPKLFLFDEPLSNLDAKLRASTRAELKRLITRYKVTGVYVTHDQSEALALCDRLAIMNEGHIEQVGTAHYLLDHPLSTMVATFLVVPPMNLFVGELAENAWRNASFSVPLGRDNLAPRGEVTLGVRAEHVHLDVKGPLRGVVSLTEPLWAERAVLTHVDLDRCQVIARLPLEAGVHVGDVISLTVDPEHLHFFDTRSGRRL